jgi:hypothetical protein
MDAFGDAIRRPEQAARHSPDLSEQSIGAPRRTARQRSGARDIIWASVESERQGVDALTAALKDGNTNPSISGRRSRTSTAAVASTHT